MNLQQFEKSTYKDKLKADLAFLKDARMSETSADISMTDYLKKKHDVSFQGYMEDMGLELNQDTIANIVNSSEYNEIRWLVPEIFREALRAGIRKAPIFNRLIVSEQSVKGKTITTPWINMSDATPARVDEGETIPLGSLSVGQKSVSIYKIGRGIKLTDEVKRYINLNVVSIYFQDFGIKMGHAMDVLAIDCLINGDQGNGSDSADVIGVATGGTLVYADLLNIWIRASRLGRNLDTMIASETMAKIILDLDEFKNSPNVAAPEASLTMETPVPNKATCFVHGNVPTDQVLLLDSSVAMIKYNATGLLIEEERIVSNQTSATYASITTGFAKLFLDGSVVVDKSLTFAATGFPDYFDVDSALNAEIE